MSRFRDKLRAVFQSDSSAPLSADSPQPYSRPAPLKPYWTASLDIKQQVSEEWRLEQGDHGWGNNELQNYTDSPENALYRIGSDGRTQLALRAIVASDRATSARLTSKATLARDQGYLCARITAPTARGVWPAFWLLPSEPFQWPTDGEVDIMESWNGEKQNHSCLHWGQHNAQDHDKHRVVQTAVPDLDKPQGKLYGFAWKHSKSKLLWYIDDKPVMQADIPYGIRRIDDFQIKLNIALGGNVCGGIRPDYGIYEMQVHDIGLFEAPPGGWESFEKQIRHTPDGRP